MTALHPGPVPEFATISTSAFRVKLTLNADGTGSTSAFSGEGTTLTQGSWTLSGIADDEGGTDVRWEHA